MDFNIGKKIKHLTKLLLAFIIGNFKEWTKCEVSYCDLGEMQHTYLYVSDIKSEFLILPYHCINKNLTIILNLHYLFYGL